MTKRVEGRFPSVDAQAFEQPLGEPDGHGVRVVTLLVQGQVRKQLSFAGFLHLIPIEKQPDFDEFPMNWDMPIGRRRLGAFYRSIPLPIRW